MRSSIMSLKSKNMIFNCLAFFIRVLFWLSFGHGEIPKEIRQLVQKIQTVEGLHKHYVTKENIDFVWLRL